MVLIVNSYSARHAHPTDECHAIGLNSSSWSGPCIDENWYDGPLAGVHHLCWNPETGQHESMSATDLTRPSGWSQRQWSWRLSQHAHFPAPCGAPAPSPSALWTWPSISPPCSAGPPMSPPLCCLPGDISPSVHENPVGSLFQCDDVSRGSVLTRSSCWQLYAWQQAHRDPWSQWTELSEGSRCQPGWGIMIGHLQLCPWR